MTLPAWVPADERKPAPPPLLLVQSFVNTRDLDRGTDLLTDAEAASAWLRDCGLIGAADSAGAEDLSVARAVREGIRGLLTSHSGGPAPTAEDLMSLRAVTGAVHPRLTVSPSGHIDLGPTPGGKLAAGLVSLLLIARDAQRDGTWLRLKVCGNRDCRWVFYDRSHSRMGTWCDMSSCGNLIKNRNLRARRGARAG